MLTEKQKNLCHEYISNNGHATKAYLTAYNSKSESSARIEASKLLRRDDITEYIQALTKPTQNRVINEREKKRTWLWNMIDNPNVSESDRLRAMDILNKMDSDYVNINRNINEDKTEINNLDTNTLLRLVK
jgi:phage terminase small subunit